MSFGRITKIELDPASGTMSGELKDLDTDKAYAFQKETGIPDVTRQDIVNYTDANGTATGLTPNLAVKLHDLQTASPDVQTAAAALTKAMARDKNMTDVVVKKV